MLPQSPTMAPRGDAAHPGALPSVAKQPYIPKLSYRTNAPDSLSTLSTSSAASPSTTPTSPLFSISRPVPPARPPLDATSPTGGRFPSDQAPKSISIVPPTPKTPPIAGKKEKKGGSFFSFLSVKEPSAQAFEDYQNKMRRKNQGQRARPTPVGMPGVSSSKLPPTVPKVNTKWDGVPLALKEKEKEKEKAKNPNRLSVSAASMKGGPPNRPSGLSRSGTSNSASSTGSGNRLAEIYGWSTPPSSSSGSIAKDFALEHNKPRKTASTTTLPETTLYPTHPGLPPRSVSEQAPVAAELPDSIPPVPELPFSPAPYPELPQDSAIIPELPSQPLPWLELPASPVQIRPKSQRSSLDLTRRPALTVVGPKPVSAAVYAGSLEPTLPPPRTPLRPPPVPELESDLVSASRPSAVQRSPLPSPAEWSPVTPSASFRSSKLSSPNLDLESDEVIKQTVIEVPKNTDEVIIVSSGVNVLAPPVSARRSQKPPNWDSASRHPFLAGEATELILTDESPPVPRSILKKDSSMRRNRSSARPQLPSYFRNPSPSKDLEPGSSSLRDRMGFGGGSKGLSPNPPSTGPAGPNAERSITPTPESGNAGTVRKKRGLAMFHRKETAESQ